MKKALITIIIGIVLVAGSYGIFQYNKYKEKPITDVLTHLEDSKVSSIDVTKMNKLKFGKNYTFKNDNSSILKSLKKVKLRLTKDDYDMFNCNYIMSITTDLDRITIFLFVDEKEMVIFSDTESWGRRHYKATDSDFFDVVETLLTKENEDV
ncbi:hypothetical protein [Viridibacillus sp. FSL H8-0123]|uniref:hypothetical protein n=1 Tax=Viridibacillus sp. FSL H8-0123 TaxID=1928922 RepID=UPI00096D5A9D|nr:hypothetical protein [Viridibacillus sp. FSL H8-0123]OMC83572.1 hypothetical protein BK130_08555 [Viridibacillus sp. FSL H8-0123]